MIPSDNISYSDDVQLRDAPRAKHYKQILGLWYCMEYGIRSEFDKLAYFANGLSTRNETWTVLKDGNAMENVSEDLKWQNIQIFRRIQLTIPIESPFNTNFPSLLQWLKKWFARNSRRILLNISILLKLVFWNYDLYVILHYIFLRHTL